MFGFLSRLGGGADLLAKADAARDRRDWIVAARFYKHYLSKRSKSPDIWVQYGHSLKEGGDLPAAAAAYAKALSLDPENFDTHLQIGHLLKLQGNVTAATHSYKIALKLNPLHADAAQELRSLGTSEAELSSLIQEDRAKIHHPSSILEGRLAALEEEFAPLRKQFGLLVARLSDTKALHFEVQNQRTELISLRSRLEGEASESWQAAVRQEIKAEFNPLKIQFGRLASLHSDAKAMHFEMRRQEISLRSLADDADCHRSEAKNQLDALTEQLADLSRHGQKLAQSTAQQLDELRLGTEEALRAGSTQIVALGREWGESRAAQLQQIQHMSSELKAMSVQCAELRRIADNIEMRLNNIDRQQSEIDAALAILQGKVTDIVTHADDPLQGLVIQLADRLQNLATKVAAQDTRVSLLEGRGATAQSLDVHTVT